MMKEYLRHKAKGGKTEGGSAWGHSKRCVGVVRSGWILEIL